MRLSEWIEERGKGAIAELSYDARISAVTIRAAINGQHIGRYQTAKAISEATGGEVSIEELCDPGGE